MLLLSRYITQPGGEKVKDEIMPTYPAGKQYLAFPETKKVGGDTDTFMRRRDGSGSWEMEKMSVLLLIETVIMGDKNAKN